MYTLTIFSGVVGGDLLDVHAAGRAGHHHRLARRAIEHDAQIQLARHLQTLLDEHARDRRGLRGRSDA